MTYKDNNFTVAFVIFKFIKKAQRARFFN